MFIITLTTIFYIFMAVIIATVPLFYIQLINYPKL